jgi:MerR family transcriptional regulator, copper efflux regulator
MRITEAARRLDMTPRMLRYRESLGLLPTLRHAVRGRTAGRLGAAESVAGLSGTELSGTGRPAGTRPAGRQLPGRPLAAGRPGVDAAAAPVGPPLAGLHRQFTETDLAAVALGVSLERRYDISPVALGFGIRVLADPRVRADVAEFGRRIGRIQPPPARALDFEQERAQRLLRLGETTPPPAAGARRSSPHPDLQART